MRTFVPLNVQAILSWFPSAPKTRLGARRFVVIENDTMIFALFDIEFTIYAISLFLSKGSFDTSSLGQADEKLEGLVVERFVKIELT